MAPLIGFLGLGSAGARLLGCARRQGCRVVAYRRIGGELPRHAHLDESETAPSLEALLERRPDGIVIATPTASHAADVRACAVGGVPMLVEKPLVTSTAELDALVSEIDGIGDRILVGYNLRFVDGHRALQSAVKSRAYGKPIDALLQAGGRLADWRPWKDPRAFYSVRRAEGGGVLLDLSHELDTAADWFGPPQRVLAVIRRVGDTTDDAEDLAVVVLDYGSGIVECRLDYLRQPFGRSYRIVCESGTLTWDQDHSAVVTTAGRKRELAPATPATASYDAEMAHFLECVRGEAHPTADTRSSRLVLQIADAARRASERGTWIDL